MEETLTLTPENEVEIKQAVVRRLDEMDETDRDSLVVKIRDDYEGITQGLIDAAKGMWVQKSEKDKRTGIVTKKVYLEKPDTDVAIYLLNQLVGKPKETQIMEGRVVFNLDV